LDLLVSQVAMCDRSTLIAAIRQMSAEQCVSHDLRPVPVYHS